MRIRKKKHWVILASLSDSIDIRIFQHLIELFCNGRTLTYFEGVEYLINSLSAKEQWNLSAALSV